MNQELKKSWLSALRSDRYRQGKGFLREGNSYCCLGVLCDIMESPWDRDEKGVYHNDGSSGCLPTSISKYSGVTPRGLIENTRRAAEILRERGIKSDEYTCLTELNDVGVSFSTIADIIEECL